MLDQLSLAIIDVETTGSSATFDRVIEIGLYRIEGGQMVDTFHSLVDPGCRLPPFITQITGITDADLAGAPTFAQIAARVHALLESCVFVAHNARFDYGFIRQEFERAGRPFCAPCLCTVRLSRLLYPRHRRHSLATLIERFAFTYARRHRALDDAAVVWQFLQHVQAHCAAAKVAAAVQQLLQTPTLPPRLKPAVVEALPEGPGVYVFYDAHDMPLYVGKSVDLRGRVLSHFANDYRSGKDQQIVAQVARIETHLTHGELGALLWESQLIKTLRPPLNRRGRLAEALVVIREGTTPQGYQTARMEVWDPATPGGSDVLGMFRGRAPAKRTLEDVAATHQLCPQLLGLNSARGACLSRQLGVCQGACAGQEEAWRYNARFAMAFANHRLKPWPFEGPIVLEERSADRTQGHLFLFDQWRLQHALRYDEAGVSRWFADGVFDYERYRLLLRYLPSAGALVRRLPPAQAEQWLQETLGLS